MRQKHIQHSIDSRLNHLRKALPRVLAHFDPEDIHAFRVEVKKLRALLTLLAAEDPQDASLTRSGRVRLPRRLRRFYKMTGEIRNLQLQQQRVQEYWKMRDDALPRTYCLLLEMELAGKITVAGDFAAKKLSIKTIQRQILDRTPDHIRKRSARKFLRSKAFSLEELKKTPQPWEDDLFHSIRKLLKDLLYIIPELSPGLLLNASFTNLLPAAPPGSSPDIAPAAPAGSSPDAAPGISAGKLRPDKAARLPPDSPDRVEKKLRPLTDTLGALQDSCIALALLDDTYLCRIKDDGETALLMELKNEWREEKARIRGDLYRQLGSGQSRETKAQQNRRAPSASL